MLVFSEHDVIRDPPFSKLDLVSCRNLLIYMNAELQKKLIPLFHYALNPGGCLVLGNSETVGEGVDLFSTLNGSLRLYQRKAATPGHTGLQSDVPGPWSAPLAAQAAAALCRILLEWLPHAGPAAVTSAGGLSQSPEARSSVAPSSY